LAHINGQRAGVHPPGKEGGGGRSNIRVPPRGKKKKKGPFRVLGYPKRGGKKTSKSTKGNWLQDCPHGLVRKKGMVYREGKRCVYSSIVTRGKG